MDIANEVHAILDERGPTRLGDLVTALLERDPSLTAGQISEAMPDDALAIHEEYVVRASWLSGCIFTHRLTEAEVRADLIPVTPDFTVLLNVLPATEDDWQLADGTPVLTLGPWVSFEDVEIPAELSDVEILFALPPGWLTGMGLGAGDLLGLRHDPAGWSAEVVAAPTADTAEVLASLQALPDDEPTGVDDWVWQVVARTRLFGQAQPPLSELIAASDLELHADMLTTPNFDPSAYVRRMETERLRSSWDLNPQELTSLAALRAVSGAMMHLPGEAPAAPAEAGFDASRIAHDLSHPYVNDVAVHEVVLNQSARPADISRALDLLEPDTPAQRAAVTTLRGHLALREGDHLLAGRLFAQALATDPDCTAAMLALAVFESDRGNAGESLTLFTRADALDHPLAEVVAKYVSAAPKVGRNQPCPCGSGKKYKQCHLGKPLSPLPERTVWLTQKAYDFVEQRALARLDRLALEVAEEDLPFQTARGLPLLYELLLFREGYLAQFLAERGSLLPDDERELVQVWLDSPGLRLLKVTILNPGKSVEVRDVGTGEVLTVCGPAGSQTLRKGLLFVSRADQAGQETWQFFGDAWPVSEPMGPIVLQALEDPTTDVAELVYLITRTRQGSATDESGEQLVVCTGRIDPRGDVELLDDVFEPAEDGWLDLDGDQVRAWLRIDGDHLRLEAMTPTRFRDAVNLLESALPEAVLLDHCERPLDLGPGSLAAPTPEQQAELEALMHRMELRWVNEPIPALEGLTPQEALADPIRRDALQRLLNTFPPKSGPGMLDPVRLRELLGL